jgi:hypothetical protein
MMLLFLLQRISSPGAGPYLGVPLSVGAMLLCWGFVCLGEVLSPCPDYIPLVSYWFFSRFDSAGLLLWIPPTWDTGSELANGVV